jgi:hypothetical protein
MRKEIIAFFPAVLGAYLVASVLATQVILARLSGLGMPITLRDRLEATGHDLVGLATSYLPILALAYLLALPVAVALANYLHRYRVFIYGLAGALAVLAIHILVKAVLGLNGLAAARDLHGLLLQGLAGWFGGYLFYVFTGQAHR